VAPSSALAFTGPGFSTGLPIAAGVLLLLGVTLLLWTKRSA
jgi:LPXTG-motif cell wall-anchored protein